MKHIIRDYDQALIRLTQLTQDYRTACREYKFALGDLFNEVIPPGPTSPKYAGHGLGMTAPLYTQRVGSEIGRLLEESGASEYISRDILNNARGTARAWKKAERTFDVPFGVYLILNAHKDLIRDGMTTVEAKRAVAEANGHRGPVTKQHPVFNQTQRLTIVANQLAGQLEAFSKGYKAEGESFSDEDIEKVREMYRALDEFVTENAIEHIWDLSETRNEPVAA